MKTTIITKDDINNPLHPYLWGSLLEDLGADSDSEEIVVCLAHPNEEGK